MNTDWAASRHERVHLICKTLACLLLAIPLTVLQFAITSPARAQTALSQPLIVKWRYESDRTTNLTPASDKNAIYLPLAEGVLIALNSADGKLIWKAETGGEFSASPAADERSVFVPTQYVDTAQGRVHGTLRALSKSTGVTLWMRTLPAPLAGSLVAGPSALFAGSADGRVYAFDKRTGLTLWINQYGEAFSSQPALARQFVYVGSEGGTLLALDQATGALIWQYRARARIQGPIAIANGTVFFGSGDGYVYAFSELRSKLVWRRRTGAAVQAVVAVDNGLLAVSLDNFAYLLSVNKGSLVWRRQLPGRISSRPITAADGALFTPLSTDSAIVLGLRDGKPVNTLALGEDNSSSAAPIMVGDLVLITTPHGLLAFAAPQQKP
ncbi:MAG TPA: PQQ-binding-like beta-propeller repeat protein [Pyrinomonadaceae bacterium]|nr:PQQ-binding-like beta-propeller repeat protein [Pyrinomonadaceae bacterium]